MIKNRAEIRRLMITLNKIDGIYYLIPKTTINTVVKECIQNVYVTFSVPEKKEKNIELTETGKEFAQNLLAELFEMEDSALDETITKYSPDFISAIEYFTEMMNQKSYDYHGEQTHES